MEAMNTRKPTAPPKPPPAVTARLEQLVADLVAKRRGGKVKPTARHHRIAAQFRKKAGGR